MGAGIIAIIIAIVAVFLLVKVAAFAIKLVLAGVVVLCVVAGFLFLQKKIGGPK